MKSLSLSLQFVDDRHRAVLGREFVRRCLRRALAASAQLTVRCVDEHEMRALNAQYRGKDYATNVLTFVYDEPGESVYADIVLCPAVIEREAVEQGKAVQEHYAHMLVHSALHAQGFEHEDDEQAHIMQGRETDILHLLGYPDPYATQGAADGVDP